MLIPYDYVTPPKNLGIREAPRKEVLYERRGEIFYVAITGDLFFIDILIISLIINE